MGARVTFFSLLFFLPVLSFSQTFQEWTQPQRTQLRYLAKQIAGLQIYIDLAREGYTVVSDGLALISDLKDGDFHLHKDFFNRRSRVNPALRNVLAYDGPCREEFDRLLRDDYYELTDDERLKRLREIIFNCKR